MEQTPRVDLVTLIKDGQPYYGNADVDPGFIDKHIERFESGVQPHVLENTGAYGVSMRAAYLVDDESWTAVVVTNGIKDDGGPKYVTVHTFRSGQAAGWTSRVVVDVLAALAWPEK